MELYNFYAIRFFFILFAQHNLVTLVTVSYMLHVSYKEMVAVTLGFSTYCPLTTSIVVNYKPSIVFCRGGVGH